MLFSLFGSTSRYAINNCCRQIFSHSFGTFSKSGHITRLGTELLVLHRLPASKASWTGHNQLRFFFSRNREKPKRARTTEEKNRTTLMYLASAVIATVGASYAAVPLYRVFCQSTNYGGTVSKNHDTEKVETMKPKPERLITVRFNADTAAAMRWNFRPQQPIVEVHPGETALAFYTARNPTDKPIDGISTYNVVPFEAGQYFNKIQCFCFEEQRLNPGEEVDMPVFFYIDPEFIDDPYLEDCEEITLSYTFFESRPGLVLPTYNSSQRSK